MTKEELAKKIDHTLLKASATKQDIIKLCEEAKLYGFASVCVNPCYVVLASGILRNSDVKVCTVVGFPLGSMTSSMKAKEAEFAVLQGADEVDMVINVGALKQHEDEYVKAEIENVVKACKVAAEKMYSDVVVKVIIETCYLSDEEKKRACLLACAAKADFVKTSTGFATVKDGHTSGATVSDVKLMNETVASFGLKVKASGGIRDTKTALEMIEAGASRLGVSAGVAIIEGFEVGKDL